MDITVTPSSVKGSITAPASKSMSQRFVAAALLARGESTIINLSFCDDSRAALRIAESLGAVIKYGTGGTVIRSSGNLKENVLDCGESGLAIRMFSPIAALHRQEIMMTGTGSLKSRPMSMIEDALRQFGVKCNSTGGFPPLKITGPITGGKCEIDGSISSQLLTGLLMALPVAENDTEIKVNNLKSKPYIDMTLQVLDMFGIRIINEGYSMFRINGNQKYIHGRFEVESDWSGGAFLLVAGAVNGDITVNGLRPDSRQSDKAILSALDSAGAEISVTQNSVSVKKSRLKPFEFDATESPDLFPPLAALASYCIGISRIKGVSRLRHKESDRADALVDVLGKMNVRAELSGDHMLITGGKVSGGIVSSHGDHRIAMAAAVAAMGASAEVKILDSHCISKSYPEFFSDLGKIGLKVNG